MQKILSLREEKLSEEYHVDADGWVLRTVNRRDPSMGSVTTTVCQATDSIPLRDATDAGYLRLADKPHSSGAGPRIRVADLFSGCGAMSLGVAEACRALGYQFVPAAAFDINSYALEVYADNFGVELASAVDLSGLSSIIGSASTPTEVGLSRKVSEIDIVVAGPPCQGHSNLNNHTRRNDPKNGLYIKVARFAELFRPRYVIIENVPSVLNDKQGAVPRTEIAFEQLGYRVQTGVVDLSRIGVPQSRKRHVLVAAREEEEFRLQGVAEMADRHVTAPRSVEWAIGDLVDCVDADDLYNGVPNLAQVTRERIDYLFDNGLHNLPDDVRPDCHRTKNHSYPAVYGRMHWDRPAPTITSGFVTMGRGRFVHPVRRRNLTAHEAARLQFIPDFFSFAKVDKRNKLAELIGNAVPPKLSYVIALELLR